MKEINIPSSIRHIKNQQFADFKYEDWLLASEKSLKTSLSNYYRTYETIQLKPLYTKEDDPQLQHIQTSNQANWKITQSMSAKSGKELNEELLGAFELGLETISFTLDLNLNIDELQAILSNINLKEYPFFINGKHLTIPFQLLLAEYCERNNVSLNELIGFIGSDPFQYFGENSLTKEEAKSYYKFWAKSILKVEKRFPNMQSIFVDTTIYENAGATVIQQLAYFLSVMVDHIEALIKEGMNIENAFQKTVLGFAISSDFFMEIAKLRAAKYLWYKLQEAYEIKELIAPTIYGETTSVNQSAIEPYMNILRTSGEALSAVIGQIDYLQVSPFNELSENQSRLGKRLSINTHHLLRQEAGLNYVIDPAAGSYYIESLTKSLIEEAWQLFLKIQENDSFFDSFVSGSIQKELELKRSERQKEFDFRKRILVGANRFIDNKAEILKPKVIENNSTKLKNLDFNELSVKIKEGYSFKEFIENEKISTDSISKLQYFRYTEELEKIREATSYLAKYKKPIVGIISLGDFKQAKPIIDFAIDTLAAGGIEVNVFETVSSLDQAKQFIEASNYPIYCLIDESINDQDNTINKIKTEYSNKNWIFASLNELNNLESNQFMYIYRGMNHIQFLNNLLALLKEESN